MSLYTPTEENEVIVHAVSQLARKYAGKFDEAEIRPIVRESYESFSDAKVRRFVAVFTTRYADDRLRAMAKVRGLITDAPPSVLFVCVHNAGRSQMAAGWVRHLSKGKIEVYSGGSLPGKDLNVAAVAAMQEVGIDIANEFPKPFAVEIVQAADVASTRTSASPAPLWRAALAASSSVSCMATPVDVSLWVRHRVSASLGRGWGCAPGSHATMIGSPRCGAAATASANFWENSPNTRCWLHC